MGFKLRGKLLNLALIVACSSGFLLSGYDNGVMSGLITASSFFDQFPSVDGNTSLQGTVCSLLSLGVFFGALAISVVGDRLGRRNSMFLGSFVISVGIILQTTSYQLSQMIVGRIITGMGLGILTSTTPTYQAECSKPTKRGRHIGTQLSTLVLGLVIAYWVEYGFAYLSGPVVWRFPLGFQLVFVINMSFILCFLPDTPRWLISVDRVEEGTQVLADFRGCEVDDEVIAKEAAEILYSIELERNQKGWKELLNNDGIQAGNRVMIACIQSAFQQLTGTNALTYYSIIIYQDNVGMTRHMAQLMGGFLQIWFLVTTIISCWLLGRVGRRSFFLVAFPGLGISMAVLGAMINTPGTGAGIVAAAATFAYQGLWGIGSMGNTWCYPPELLPLNRRAKGVALSTASSGIFTFLVVEIVPVGAASIGYKLYIIFAIINFAMAIFAYFFFPETAALTLESTDLLFTESAHLPFPKNLLAAVKKSLEIRKTYIPGQAIDLQANDKNIQNIEKAMHVEVVEA